MSTKAGTFHLVGLDYLVANTDMLQEMTPQDREIFQQEWTKTYEEFVVLWDKATQEAIAGATDLGAQFHEIDTEPFDEQLDPLTRSFLTSATQQELFEKTREAATP